MNPATLLAMLAAATPIVNAYAINRTSKYENLVYWGQNDNEQALSHYCTPDQDIGIIVLAFIDSIGNGQYPSGNFGSCQINSDQTFSDCDSLASDITTCQSAGVKVFLSIGGSGADNTWSLTGTADAQGVASSLWDSYGHPAFASNGSARPFGNSFVDGWDFDLESQGGDSYKYLGDLVNALRGYFSKDSNHTYYISGAPQCPTPDANLNDAIQAAQFDYLFIQSYQSYNNYCRASDLFSSSSNPDGFGSFNLADWPGTISGGASANAKLHVGLPALKSAAQSYDYVSTANIPALLSKSSGVAGFNGFML